ncbi:MAG: hypothetical protein WCP55_12980 [Lentisphaerota bacterium]|jgi:hypothetical protein
MNSEQAKQPIYFTLNAKIDDREVTPSTIGFSLFNAFNHEVEEFIAGSQKKIPTKDVNVGIEPGSYKLMVLLPVTILSLIQPDLTRLQNEDSLGSLDPRRANVVRKWQERAQKSDFSVVINSPKKMFEPIRISKETDFRRPDQNEWVAVEKYLIGKIVDLGGATKTNVHILLDDSGKIITLASSERYLHDQRQNYLYRKVQVRIAAKENIRTGEMRDIELVSFIGEAPSYDEMELEELINKGTKAWADVPNSVVWVREQRDGK